jgi:antitoxin component HigA of HigAB toxin-antitoxin module
MQITTEAEYLAALDRVDRLMNRTQAGTPEREELIALSDAVEAYEEIHYPITALAEKKDTELATA